MSMYIGDMLDEVAYDNFDIRLNFLDENTFEFTLNYILHDNGGYNFITKFFVCMESLFGGYDATSVTLIRREQKVIIKSDWLSKEDIEPSFERCYEDIKKCLNCERYELEDQIEYIRDIM